VLVPAVFNAKTAWAVGFTLHEAAGQHSPEFAESAVNSDLHNPHAITEKVFSCKESQEQLPVVSSVKH